MEIIPDKRKLVGLVESAHVGKLCLPDFQREFVWTREQVSDLLRSVVRGYFIGTLLLLRCDPESPPFAPVFVRGARPLHREPRPELLILDGQQRLGSLLYALTAPDLGLKDTSTRRWFFLDLRALLGDKDDDAIVFDRSRQDLGGLDAPERQYQRLVIPFTKLFRPSDFMKWRDGLDDWLREHEPARHRDFREKWRDPWTETVNTFQNFDVALVELPRVNDQDSEAIGVVCAIFEKLNSTGTELSVYDLLTARLYRAQIRLHDLWDEAVRQHKRLSTWSGGKAETNKFGVLLLRVVALLRGLEVKPRVLINLLPENFAQDWRRAAAAMERALELVELVESDGFGVFERKWLPGYALLPVLAALRAEIEDRGLGQQARADLRRWYWANVFMERYSSAVESKSRKDYSEMLAYWNGGPDPDLFREARARIGSPGYSIRGATSVASALYSGIFNLLALRGARDWRRGETIQLQDLQDHHLFPQAYLYRHGIQDRSKVNTIANRTLIGDETNLRIAARAPADYVESDEIFPGGEVERLLEPHFVDAAALGAMRQARENLAKPQVVRWYEEFLTQRDAAIVAEIREVTGAPLLSEEEAADFEVEEIEGAPELEDEGPIGEEVSEVKALQHEFWRSFVSHCRERGTWLKLRRPRPQQWYNFSLGRTGFVISLTTNTQGREAACKLYVSRDDAREAFLLLKRDADEIESRLGQLEWDSREGRLRCQVVQRFSADITDRSQWSKTIELLKERAEAFHAVFAPRVQALPLRS